ncbi:hypothetical protein [Methylosinus sp. Sm6]|uniref:hypothetical protein n=1 Tax=Methylosinus sp. Sm6 TaxID=2866948 RepID=UPI001C9A0F69|nr:hypothetical protein [Methylosinus sp. Sm6]MBY6244039.1 hypothetical protein [Methylosinus sp. Sm6]
MYYEITLSRRVEIDGHGYLPNLNGSVRHVVDQTTLDALVEKTTAEPLGDAVVEARPIAEGDV